jgi:HD-like signal output (HDOD) protein
MLLTPECSADRDAKSHAARGDGRNGRRRILFVDDESRVLEGLRRSLHARRTSWDMVFSENGAAALGELEHEPFDVIISDMRMPGMDGATLLKRVQQQYPSMVRIILSGYSELEAALRTVPVAHQFLAKPCTADMLTNVVERACSLQSLLDDDSVRRVVGRMDSLPSQPKMYQELTRVLSTPGASIRTVASIVERDVAMCAKILQLVNSSFFAMPRHLPSVEAAVSYLGTNMIKQLVLSVEAFCTWKSIRIPGFDLEGLMQHAFIAANLARRLLTAKGEAEDAFMATMLHDIGRLILASAFPQQLARVLETSKVEVRPIEQIEHEVLGVSHGHIGAYLLGLWGVPYPIVEAVANHDAPASVPQEGFGILGAVYVADQLAHECAPPESSAAGQVREPLDQAYLESLGVSDRLSEWRALAQDLTTTTEPA